ncbi:MAG: hypothetical protein CM15mP25_4350 [Gammaproteobacteria bacterium]|nr:MAG: hypothetical protein CM15mP25_4350 [Gammaproteobacteria bacterium]
MNDMSISPMRWVPSLAGRRLKQVVILQALGGLSALLSPSAPGRRRNLPPRPNPNPAFVGGLAEENFDAEKSHDCGDG